MMVDRMPMASFYGACFLQVITDFFQVYRIGYKDFIQPKDDATNEELSKNLLLTSASLISDEIIRNTHVSFVLSALVLILCVSTSKRILKAKEHYCLPLALSSTGFLLTFTADVLRFHGYSVSTAFQRAIVFVTLLQIFCGQTWYIIMLTHRHNCDEKLDSILLWLICIYGIGKVSASFYLGALTLLLLPNHSGLVLPLLSVFINMANIIFFTPEYLRLRQNTGVANLDLISKHEAAELSLHDTCKLGEGKFEDRPQKQSHKEGRSSQGRNSFVTIYFILEIFATIIRGFLHRKNVFMIVTSILDMNISGNIATLICCLVISMFPSNHRFINSYCRTFLALGLLTECLTLTQPYSASPSAPFYFVQLSTRFISLFSRSMLFVNVVSSCPRQRVSSIIGGAVIVKLLVLIVITLCQSGESDPLEFDELA